MSYPYLVYETDLLSSEIRLVREGDDLVMVHVASGGRVVFHNYFGEGWVVQEIHLSDSQSIVLRRPEVDATLANGGVVPSGVNLTGAGMLAGTSYIDVLTATAYGTRLEGGGGNDILGAAVDGGVFDLTFVGGSGNDVLNGSYASDTYHYALGDGHDLVRDDVRAMGASVAAFFAAHPGTGTYQDQLVFGAGIAAADIQAERVQDDLVLHVRGDEGSVTVAGWYGGTMFNKIESFVFADGTTWLASDIDRRLGQASIGMTHSGDGTITGSQYDDRLTATGYGTRLEGGLGNDTLSAAVDGGVFDLSLEGGRGNDVLIGSYARDVYHYALGDGHDLVRDDVRSMGPDVSAFFAAHPGTGTYQDQLVFGAGITAADIQAERVQDDLVLHVRGDQGSITLDGWYDGTMFSKIESFRFADGTNWLAADIDRRLGEWSAGMVQNGSGVLDGSQYDDSLTATGYGTLLQGGYGNDTLAGAVDGGIFDLRLVGGLGNDVLVGSYAGDSYWYDTGHGHDLIIDDVRSMGPGVADFFYARPNTDTYQDRLVFGPGIGLWDINPERVGTDLVLQIENYSGSITIAGWYDGTMFNKIEKFLFQDGRELLASDIDLMLDEWSNGMVASGSGLLEGSQYSDSLTAAADGTLLQGGAGWDHLFAGGRSDVHFSGGRGNDVLNGGLANDVYSYETGDGYDLIREDGGHDALHFAAGIAAHAVTRTRAGQDMVLDINEPGTPSWGQVDPYGIIVVEGWFDGTGSNKIELIGFADGTTWTAAMAEQGL